jgi:hypothetical protein
MPPRGMPVIKTSIGKKTGSKITNAAAVIAWSDEVRTVIIFSGFYSLGAGVTDISCLLAPHAGPTAQPAQRSNRFGDKHWYPSLGLGLIVGVGWEDGSAGVP